MSHYPSAQSPSAARSRLPSQKELAQLAREDPQAFETLRSELIENAILRAPERMHLHLRQLQFRLDGIRRLTRTPLGALLKMQGLMWESFLRMDDALQHLDALTRAKAQGVDNGSKANSRSAQIIDFRTRQPLAGG